MRANDVYMCVRIRFNEMKKREKVSVVPSPSLTKQQTTMRERERIIKLSRLLIIIINVKKTTNRLDGGDDGGQFGRGTNTTQIYNINARRGREENKTTTITSEYKEK